MISECCFHFQPSRILNNQFSSLRPHFKPKFLVKFPSLISVKVTLRQFRFCKIQFLLHIDVFNNLPTNMKLSIHVVLNNFSQFLRCSRHSRKDRGRAVPKLDVHEIDETGKIQPRYRGRLKSEVRFRCEGTDILQGRNAQKEQLQGAHQSEAPIQVKVSTRTKIR